MPRKSEKGVLLILAAVVVLIVAATASTLIMVSTAGAMREQTRDSKFKSREIAEAALDISLNSLRQATDGLDNDGDGTVDEGFDEDDLFALATVTTLEGNLGRLGTVNWSLADDTNGNGMPDIGESGVVPVDLSGGQIITYSIFSEADGQDNDADGVTDEEDEAGSVSIVAQGRFEECETLVRYSGIFTETMGPPNPPT